MSCYTAISEKQQRQHNTVLLTRSDPPIPILTTSVIGLPVNPAVKGYSILINLTGALITTVN